jgi:hypothetical protein
MPLYQIEVECRVVETTCYYQTIPAVADYEEAAMARVREMIDDGRILKPEPGGGLDAWDEDSAEFDVEEGDIEIVKVTEETEATGSEETEATE